MNRDELREKVDNLLQGEFINEMEIFDTISLYKRLALRSSIQKDIEARGLELVDNWTMLDLVKYVSDRFKVDYSSILGKSRKGELPKIRTIVCYVLLQNGMYSAKEVTDVFGRDISYAVTCRYYMERAQKGNKRKILDIYDTIMEEISLRDKVSIGNSLSNREVGERVKSARGERGITQQKLAALTGIKQSYLESIEGGKLRASRSILTKIRRVLKIKDDTVFWEQN